MICPCGKVLSGIIACCIHGSSSNGIFPRTHVDTAGLFEWSMKFQDSTHDGSTQARAMSDEDKKWYASNMVICNELDCMGRAKESLSHVQHSCCVNSNVGWKMH